MMKFCPACGEKFDDQSMTACPEDGQRLMLLQRDPDLVGETLGDDKYEITGKLGQGGMGTVYRAFQKNVNRDVAIKVLRREFSSNTVAIQRFRRESRAASQLSHPNTITVYDSGQTQEGYLFLVMEILEGQELSEVLSEERQLAPDRAAHILGQICDSLTEAHGKKFIHRDLKAENIYLVETAGNPEHVKVLDFGIAKMTEETNTQATATGMICGTPAYMSPEQAMGRDLTPASDVYAIGVLLWEMLVGTRPFAGTSPMEVMLKHINEPLPELPAGVGGAYRLELEKLLSWMMEKHASKRPQTTREVKERLQEIFVSMGTGSLRSVAPLPPASTNRRPDEVKTQDEPATLKTGLSPVAKASASLNQGLAVAVGIAIGVTALVWILGPGSDHVEEQARPPSGGPSSSPDEVTVIAPSDKVKPKTEGVKQSAKKAPAIAKAPEPREEKALPLRLDSLPTGATVRSADGKDLGTTPWSTTCSEAEIPLVVTVSLAGHADARVELDPTVREAWNVSLVAEVAPQPPARKTPVKARSGTSPAPTPAPAKKAPVQRSEGEKKERGNPRFGTF